MTPPSRGALRRASPPKPWRRRVDWPERLAGCLAAARARPFAWGSHDCALFACDCVKAITGVDPGRRFRAKYKTARGAAGALRRFAGGGVEAAAMRMAADLGAPEIAVARAGRGDVVLLRLAPLAQDEGRARAGPVEALGVIDMSGRRIAAVSMAGLERAAIARGLRAWRIG